MAMALNWEEFDKILSHTVNNEIEILQSKKCGCIFCGHTFEAKSIKNWTSVKNKASAICPACGMNMIVGDSSGYSINKKWVGEVSSFILDYPEDIFEKHHEIIDRYIECYEKKLIPENEFNESRYKHYLFLGVTKDNDPRSAYKIGEIFDFGTPYTKADPKVACNYYCHPALRPDSHAMARYGICSYRADPKNAFLCYSLISKSTALGSLYGISYLYDIYLEGKIDRKDHDFAFTVLSNAFLATFQEYYYRNAKGFETVLTCLAYRMGYSFEKGIIVPKNEDIAIAYYLLTDFIYKGSVKNARNTLENDYYHKLSQTRLKRLAKKFNCKVGNPILNESTFFASMIPLTYFNGNKIQTNHLQFPDLTFVSPEEYDEESKRFTFTIRCQSFNPLIIDVDNLYCDFDEGPLIWCFENVKEVDYYYDDQDEVIFSKLELCDGKLTFYSHDNGKDLVVLEVIFENEGDFTEDNEKLVEA